MKRTVYISGAITGVPNDNLPQFRAAQEMIKDLGYNTIVPHDLDPKSDNPTWHDWMRACSKALMDADILVSLPEEKYSQGAAAERMMCKKLDIPCVTVDKIKHWDEMIWAADAVFRKEAQHA